jgi:hypothetical protein
LDGARPEIRRGIVDVAYHFKTPEVTEFMRRVLAQGKGDESDLYWPANFLAKECDAEGLAWLSSRVGRPQNCLRFQETVPLFGKCNYRQAVPYLIKNSIHDACLNIDDAAVRDLQHFFPHSPRGFDTMEEMQSYFCTRAKRENIKVDCTAE